MPIAAKVSDWGGLGDLATRAHCAPLVLSNLKKSSSNTVPSSELTLLAAASRHSAIQNLRNEAEIQYIDAELCAPVGIEALFVKGATLAWRYYEDPSLRVHRDVDILLNNEDRLKLLHACVDKGYRFFVAGREFKVQRESDTFALYEFGREVSLVSPRMAVIEVHQTIDKAMGIFPTKTLFEVAERQNAMGTTLSVLPTEWLYCYLAYHACQHNFSKLIWMVDLLAIRKSTGFSFKEVRKIAQDAGISSAVAAAHEAANVFETLDFENSRSSSPRTRQIVRACLENNGLATKLANPPHQDRPDLSDPLWLGDGIMGVKFFINRLRFLSSPGLDDYRLLPIVRKRFWVLFLLRPLMLVLRRLHSHLRARGCTQGDDAQHR